MIVEVRSDDVVVDVGEDVGEEVSILDDVSVFVEVVLDVVGLLVITEDWLDDGVGEGIVVSVEDGVDCVGVTVGEVVCEVVNVEDVVAAVILPFTQ